MIDRDPGVDGQLRAVGEGEEGVGGHGRAREIQPRRARLVDGEPYRVDPAHLARAYAGGAEALAQHDRVGAHVLAHPMANSSSPHSSLGRLALGDHLHLRALLEPGVAVLHQQSAAHALEVLLGHRRAAALLVFEQADVGLLLAAPPERRRRSPARTRAPRTSPRSRSASGRSTRRLKHITPPKALCSSVASALEKASAARRADAHPARVVVLDDRRRRQLEFLDQPAAGVEVEQVVERQLLAVELGHHRESGASEAPISA